MRTSTKLTTMTTLTAAYKRQTNLNITHDAFEQVWRNTRWGRNTQYLRHDEVESFFPKLWKLLQVFGSAFDDKWAYRKTKKYVLRFAVWDKPQSGSFWEDNDIRKRDVMQRKLLEASS